MVCCNRTVPHFIRTLREDWGSQLRLRVLTGNQIFETYLIENKKRLKICKRGRITPDPLSFPSITRRSFFPLNRLPNRWESGKKIYPCRGRVQPTCVHHFAPDGQIDVPLFGCLLHKLDDKLVRFPDDGRPVHADQFISRSQAAVGISSTQRYNVTDVNLMSQHK